MNYSKKHLKKITYNKICGYHNRIVYVYSERLGYSVFGEYMYGEYAAMYWMVARHYSNAKSYSRW